MANLDAPIGFWPVRHLSGGEIRSNQYVLTTGQIVYKGDLLKAVAGGTVQASATNDGIIVVGVAAEYKDGTVAGTKGNVFDDPNIVFGVQMDDVGIVSTAADVFNTANHLDPTGDTTTKVSKHELDMSDIDTGAQLKILGLCMVRDSNNDWGTNCDVEVLLNEHLYSAAVAKV